MNKNNFYIAIILGAMIFNACKPAAPEAPAVAKHDIKPSLQALPTEMINKMLAEVDYIDYIWHDLPFSLSQEEKDGINTNISFISNEAVPELSPDCKAIGRKFYNVKGETIATADVYFSPGCYYYVFLDGEKPIYASKITAQGINFYTQIIENQARK
ncbi:MAG: hypothetical protein IPH94_17205 [Saprospiraceae bacterium]|nr:hypothetical protein [Saprospiraceae bacterium]MBK7789284.1 hypothetical protein [Saprospiraceae bacterium]